MKKHSNSTTQLGLLATGAAALTGSAHGAMTFFDNGGSGWSFSGTIDESIDSSSTFVTSLDALGVLPAGLLDLSFNVDSRTVTDKTMTTTNRYMNILGEGDGELSSNLDFTTANFTGGKFNFIAVGETYTPLDLSPFLSRSADWNIDTTGFAGHIVFSLYDQANEDDADNSGVYLGWAELEASVTPVIGDDPWSLNIKRIGIEDQANRAIVVGAIPEASSTALLLLGAAGAAVRRRRKAA